VPQNFVANLVPRIKKSVREWGKKALADLWPGVEQLLVLDEPVVLRLRGPVVLHLAEPVRQLVLKERNGDQDLLSGWGSASARIQMQPSLTLPKQS